MKNIKKLILIFTIFLLNFNTLLAGTKKQNFVLINSLDDISFPIQVSTQGHISFYQWDGTSSYISTLSKLKNYNQIVIYLNPIDEGSNQFENNSQNLHSKHAIVWYLLSGDPTLDYVQKQTDMIKKYNNNHSKKVIGMNFDLEPWTAFQDQNSSNNKVVWQKYLDFLSDSKEILHKAHLKLSVTIPFWVDRITEAFPNDRPINYDVIDIADEIIIMTYTIYPERIQPYAKTSLSYAQSHNIRIKIALEMVKNDNENISFYTHPKEIKSILNTLIPYQTFDGYVIHTLDSFDESGIILEYNP